MTITRLLSRSLLSCIAAVTCTIQIFLASRKAVSQKLSYFGYNSILLMLIKYASFIVTPLPNRGVLLWAEAKAAIYSVFVYLESPYHRSRANLLRPNAVSIHGSKPTLMLERR